MEEMLVLTLIRNIISMTGFSQHTAHLGDGIDIFYTDSGAPLNSMDYTTLIIFHGSAFTGQGFVHLHDHAHPLNLRTVVCNRRDYPGSTRYTDSELDDLRHGRKDFLDRLAIQVGWFLEKFIDEENIPKVGADRKSGGFAILGWSMGTATAMSLFSDQSLISYTKLEPYVKDLILYDPPYLSFGYPLPVDADHRIIYDPWANPDNRPPEELYRNFIGWVTSYYDQPENPTSINELNFAKRTDHATVNSWSPEELGRIFDEGAAVRSELHMYIPPMQNTLNDLANQVLYNTGLTQIFPEVDVTYITGSKTNWQCLWGAVEAKHVYEDHKALGEKVRHTTFIYVEGGNHFIHSDMPGEFMKTIVQEIRRFESTRTQV
ncbi:hypothetical protein Hypma_013908 [Hypsizygus marmoreus]|uniref:AB hydrolase-1 domain-containing protein n=1 Tax=Hypsizygus marmoreus TaxID=39966 RepID=A0A369K9G4_HYPMA|nr:hypothetical protein Hypma_013908 [Hypsizygus marmoreus]